MQYAFDYNQMQRQSAANAMGSSFNLARINDPSQMSQRPNAFASFLTAAGGMASALNQVDYKGLNQAMDADFSDCKLSDKEHAKKSKPFKHK